MRLVAVSKYFQMSIPMVGRRDLMPSSIAYKAAYDYCLNSIFHFLCCVLIGIVETPKLEASGGILMYRENKPENPPQTDKKINELKKFCEEVEIILLTINENEYHAAALFMKKPSDSFERAVFYPKPNMVVGMFAMKKTALIQSDVGINSTPFIKEAINFFPNALYVIGVGVCYAFNPNCKFGDVLVSKQICDLRNAKFKKNGKIENRGQTIDILSDLKFFCMDLDHEYEVASPSRLSKVYTGPFVSYSALIDNKVMRNKIHKAVPGAIGGEMEGGELLDFERKRRIKGIVVIKGVVDYADGTKSKEWQFVSAMAAMNYTESKLLRVRTLRDECECM